MAKSVKRGKALVASLRAQAGVRDPEALAAYLGRFKKARKAGKSVAAAKAAAGGNGGSSGGSSKSSKKSQPGSLGMGGDFTGGGMKFAPGALEGAEKAREEIGRKHRAELAARKAKKAAKTTFWDDEVEDIKTAGQSGKKHIYVKSPSGKEGLIVNKYSPEWWKRATKKDIRRITVY